jgi:cysteine desulfurase
MLRRPIYMDNHATTRVDPRVLEAMLPYFDEHYGNAGSVNHAFGGQARDAVAAAREQLASAIGATASEIIFTSGATESNNLAIFGAAERRRRKGNHIVSVVTEHHAVLDPLATLVARGFEVTLLPVQPNGAQRAGLITADEVARVLRDDTLLVSVMMANNEIGAVQPIAEIGRLCKARGVLFHCDATQALGKLPIDVEELQVDLLSISAHKVYGPKGIGALHVRRRNPIVRLEPQIFGGGQERGLRSGTLNVPGIVGFGRAAEIAVAEMPGEAARLTRLRQRLFNGLTHALDEVTLNGPALDDAIRLTGNLNLAFAYVQGEALLLEIRELAVSSGAACTSANPEPSHVLRALGLDDDLTKSSLLFGLGRFNTEEEVDFAVERVVAAVTRLRKMSSLA